MSNHNTLTFTNCHVMNFHPGTRLLGKRLQSSTFADGAESQSKHVSQHIMPVACCTPVIIWSPHFE